MKDPLPPEQDTRSDERLVEETLQGDAKAFQVLIKRYWRMVFSLAYRGARNVNDAEDIAQESFLSAIGSLHRLKDRSKFSSWLYGLTLNTTRSFLRKKARTPSLPEPPYETPAEGPSLLAGMEDEERMNALLHAIAELKPIYRVVIEMRYMEGLSCEEIARRLGEPSGTVRSRICRASAILRRKLKKYF